MYILSVLNSQAPPPRKSEDELREEEELQLALALSQSEAEHKDKQKSGRSMTPTSRAKTYSPTPMQQVRDTVSPPLDEVEPELARYLNRSYWENRTTEESSPTAPANPPAGLATALAKQISVTVQVTFSITRSWAGNTPISKDMLTSLVSGFKMCFRQRLSSHTDMPLMSHDFFVLNPRITPATSSSLAGESTMDDTGPLIGSKLDRLPLKGRFGTAISVEQYFANIKQELSYRKPLPILRQRSKSSGLLDNVIAESRRPFSWCVALLYFRVLPLHFSKHKNSIKTNMIKLKLNSLLKKHSKLVFILDHTPPPKIF
ncbi:hypothetical protein J6590_000690 [Homalodisca vitripennis]|nr:hypothetical protein J6590_000690 [Homalodisca vitripennis]